MLLEQCSFCVQTQRKLTVARVEPTGTASRALDPPLHVREPSNPPLRDRDRLEPRQGLRDGRLHHFPYVIYPKIAFWRLRDGTAPGVLSRCLCGGLSVNCVVLRLRDRPWLAADASLN